MLPLCYHAYRDDVNPSINSCNRASVKRPIVVNCAGRLITEAEFKTDNVQTRDDYYLLFVLSGELKVTSDKGDIPCTAGTFLLFPPKYRYRYYHLGNNAITYMWIHFTGSSVKELMDEYRIGLFPKVNFVSPDDIIQMRFQNIFDAFVRNDTFRDAELSLLLERLFISLARRLCLSSNAKRPLNKAISYINGHYNKDIRIPELAKLENLSTSRFNAVFKEYVGMSPTAYIAKLRMSMACELLSSTDISVKDIAESVGYSDPHFFSRTFKNCIGESPTEYRRKN